MKSRRRHRIKEEADINITAFMNLMVILVPFLLITAVFSQITTLQLNLPPQQSGAADKDKKEKLQLEVIIRADNSLIVADRKIGRIRSIPGKDGFDLEMLVTVLKQVKVRSPETKNITLLLDPDVEYNSLIQIMDSVRVVKSEKLNDDDPDYAELFPAIAIGDAPLSLNTGKKK